MKWFICLLILILMGVTAYADPKEGKQESVPSSLEIPWDYISGGSVIDAQSGRYTSSGFIGDSPGGAFENEQISLYGGFLNPEFVQVLTSVKDWQDFGLPDVYQLQQNYPNPFNPATTIRYSLPQKCQLRLDVFDVLGQWVTTLRDGQQEPGFHVVLWDGRNAAGYPVGTGVYFYRLIARSAKGQAFIQSKKMLLVK